MSRRYQKNIAKKNSTLPLLQNNGRGFDSKKNAMINNNLNKNNIINEIIIENNQKYPIKKEHKQNNIIPVYSPNINVNGNPENKRYFLYHKKQYDKRQINKGKYDAKESLKESNAIKKRNEILLKLFEKKQKKNFLKKIQLFRVQEKYNKLKIIALKSLINDKIHKIREIMYKKFDVWKNNTKDIIKANIKNSTIKFMIYLLNKFKIRKLKEFFLILKNNGLKKKALYFNAIFSFSKGFISYLFKNFIKSTKTFIQRNCLNKIIVKNLKKNYLYRWKKNNKKIRNNYNYFQKVIIKYINKIAKRQSFILANSKKKKDLNIIKNKLRNNDSQTEILKKYFSKFKCKCEKSLVRDKVNKNENAKEYKLHLLKKIIFRKETSINNINIYKLFKLYIQKEYKCLIYHLLFNSINKDSEYPKTKIAQKNKRYYKRYFLFIWFFQTQIIIINSKLLYEFPDVVKSDIGTNIFYTNQRLELNQFLDNLKNFIMDDISNIINNTIKDIKPSFNIIKNKENYEGNNEQYRGNNKKYVFNNKYNNKNKNKINEINQKYENEIISYYTFKLKENENEEKYAINKDWINRWKTIVKYEKHQKVLKKSQLNNVQSIIFDLPEKINNLESINNKKILVDISSFLNDGDNTNIENIILKENSYEIINKELWESFKKYGYDIEINSGIINNSESNFLVNLVFLRNEKNESHIKKENSSIYLKDEKDLIKKIVKYLNLNNNEECQKICTFYNNTKFNEKNFLCNESKDSFNKKYVISLVNQKNDKIILVGLNNLGATCFMNAVLQIFNNINIFSDFLCNIDLDNKCQISKALKNVFLNLRDPHKKSYEPREFKNIIGKLQPKFLKNEPGDSRQLIQFLLNNIHKELNENKNKNIQDDDEEDTELTWEKKLENERRIFNQENKSIIIDLFYGIQSTETFCYKCQNTSYEFEYFNILTLPILQKYAKKININNMLEDYSRKIQLEGNNKNYCEFCDGEFNAYSRNIFYELPKILIIHPGRTNKGTKFNIKIEFKEEITISLSEKLEKQKIQFNLIGIIYHFGGCGHNGHNISYCKIGDVWYSFNDSKISKIDINEINGEGILLLIYQQKI